jgi:3,4-dehydroadipyl-CoA semialdehyde dehydrogenase
MGPVVSRDQQRAVQEGIAQLKQEATVVFGGDNAFTPVDADPTAATFVPPTLLAAKAPFDSRAIHEVEVFGPVATVLPYDDFAQAIGIAGLGGGSLVASVFTADRDVMQDAAGLGALHGRVHIVSGAVGKAQTGHGNVMPMSLHGGPGRAGGGQELGGLRAMRLYHQLSVVQAPTEAIEQLAQAATDFRP